MKYDPIKRLLGSFFNKAPWLRILFYRLLDLLLLRSWHIRRQLKAWYASTSAEAPHVLDAGFGFGQYSYFLAKLGNNISLKGLDVKEEQVQDCNRFFRQIGISNAFFFEADLVQWSEPGTFDLILCVDVMEHILEDQTVLNNFCISLKNGGMLMVSTPSDQGGSDVHDHGDASFIEEHVRDGYSMEDMKMKLLQAGFSKINMHYSYGRAGSLSWRLSMKYPIQMLNLSKLLFILLPFYYLLVFPICLMLNKRDVTHPNSAGTGLIVSALK
ncbi:MAG TPA: class I SAM-dependent methyltransferase [Bacteroidales bacterium]|nr:class I SAM-dependent methyltransferase [Bacteroidales bacterium]HSA42663.1 class I SAM-dependent methyltransferase [Bacteroidales bacterium]